MKHAFDIRSAATLLAAILTLAAARDIQADGPAADRITPPGWSSTAASSTTGARTSNGIDWVTETTGANERYGDWSSTTTGHRTGTREAASWSATTAGCADSGRSWTSDESGTRTKNDDGTISIEKEFTKTLDNGKTITGSQSTTVTRTEDGKTWTTEAERTGPKGTAVMTGTGTATRTPNGMNWKVDREGATAAGTSWDSSTSGHCSTTDGGRKWHSTTTGKSEDGRNRTTVRDGTHNRTENGFAAERTRKTVVSGGGKPSGKTAGKAGRTKSRNPRRGRD